MNGQLNEQPLAELIREISAKRFSGRLRLQHERITVVVYFKSGALIYVASNARILRLREYLVKHGLVSQERLDQISERSDIELAGVLTSANLLTAAEAELALTKQSVEALKLALLWTEGTWEFDSRSHLQTEVHLEIDIASLLLEAGRRLPATFAGSRFRNPSEVISPAGISPDSKLLWPEEAFLLSRLDRPTALGELLALSGLGELDALRAAYALTLSGLLHRQYWKQSFRSPSTQIPQQQVHRAEILEPLAATKEQSPSEEDTAEQVAAFLTHLTGARTHYDVLGISRSAPPEEVKRAYYDLARRYHPDRFRRRGDQNLQERIDSAFARITQAYDALSDLPQRSHYDSKLDSQARVEDLAKKAPTATPGASDKKQEDAPARKEADEKAASEAQLPEDQFKQGFAAMQLGQVNVALGFFSAAARSVPNEPRYRAYYGQALSKKASTRRLAEAELLAAIKLEPSNAEFRVMLAELYRDLGFILRAKAEADRAIERDPNNRKAHELLRSLKSNHGGS